ARRHARVVLYGRRRGAARVARRLLRRPGEEGRRHRARRVMDRLRLAIVGCGTIAHLNAPGYLAHPRCDVTALCDTRREQAERRARQWGLTPRIYTDYKQVLDDRDVDAVELLTPTHLHAEQIVAALAAGKHVSCQKPIAASVAEADRIVEAVARARTTFRVT